MSLSKMQNDVYDVRMNLKAEPVQLKYLDSHPMSGGSTARMEIVES